MESRNLSKICKQWFWLSKSLIQELCVSAEVIANSRLWKLAHKHNCETCAVCDSGWVLFFMSVGKTASMKQRRLSTHGTNYWGLDFGSFTTSRMSPFKDFDLWIRLTLNKLKSKRKHPHCNISFPVFFLRGKYYLGKGALYLSCTFSCFAALH